MHRPRSALVAGLAASCSLLAACAGAASDDCFPPFVPSTATLPPPPTDQRHLSCRPASAPAQGSDVVVGDVRVQALSPSLVRIEGRGPKGFEDRCTFVVVDRDWPGVDATVTTTPEGTLVDAGTYRVLVPGDGRSVAGTKVLAPDGTVLHVADGQAPPKAFLPSPSEPVGAWVMGDMPRLVPPEWGATPPPTPLPDSGWDRNNPAPDVYVFVPGPGGYDRLRADFLKLTGPVEMPPLYAFGVWMSRYYRYTEQTALETIDGFRRRHIPLDVLVVDTDWRVNASVGYETDTSCFPDLPRFFDAAHGQNARVVFNDHPEPEAGALDPLEMQYRWDGLTGKLAQGLDAWWFDRNWYTCIQEPVPGISKEVFGMRLYHDITARFRPDRRPLILSNVEGIDNGILRQPSSPAAHRFPVWWTGDTRATSAYLKTGIENGVHAGVRSLLPYVNEDAGGHHGDPGAWLFTRFMQFASLSPVTRPHCTNQGEKRLPWDYGPEAERIVTDYFRLRLRLLPTLYAAARRAYDDGTPLMRRLDLEWPGYPEAADSTEYLLGDDILVAPIHGNPAEALTSAFVSTPDGAPGFTAEYFLGMQLYGDPVLVRTDERIDFDWGEGSPGPGIPANHFSVRWTGVIGPMTRTGEAVLSVTGDDGFRLYVDGERVIDSWVDQASTEKTATVAMEAGRKYTIRLEYYESGGNAVCRLRWQPPGHPSPDARTVFLPPGEWQDVWTGGTVAGPARREVTARLREVPMWVRSGGVIATIPQVEHTGTAAWPRVVVDALVPASEAAARTERFLYEDDGASPGYRMGEAALTPMVLERVPCGARLVLGPTTGDFDGLPTTRSWVVRLHLPAGTSPASVRVDGRKVASPTILAPALADHMPFEGEGAPPGPLAGPVVEVVIPDVDVRRAVEVRVPIGTGELPEPFPEDAAEAATPADAPDAGDVAPEAPPDAPVTPPAFMDGATGFPVANFSIAGEVSPSGEVFRRVVYNPPVIGSWLEEWGRGTLAVESGGKVRTAADFDAVQVQRAWPRATVRWGDDHEAVTLEVEAFAPVVDRDVAATALPVLVARLEVAGPPGEPVALRFDLAREKDLAGEPVVVTEPGGRLATVGDVGLAWDGVEDHDDVSFARPDSRTVRGRVAFEMPTSGERVVHLYLLFWHPDARAAADHADLPELHRAVRKRRAELDAATAAFPSVLPASGDAKVDEYLRWYLTAAVQLTRVLRDGTTLTMGYAELNQRDSFWTSFLHLDHWPEAERRMIEESAASVREDGKVPTCILPVIEREDDIDINEYFLLRVARFHRRFQDIEFLTSIWPACRRAVDWLVGRCGEGALPEQQSSWADWKDVGGVAGRRYGPHFALLYVATLGEAAWLARELGDMAAADAWDAARVAAETKVNLPVEAGGLWNGSYYVNVWYDGRKDDALLEDQTVAGAWGVIPKERFASIRAALNEQAERPWGVRETTPYYPATFGYEGGDYHNGAVWPWLNFADAIARCRYGYREDALRILKAVGHFDLEEHGDFLPHENLHGETGQNIRHWVQGWDAAFLGAVTWGLGGGFPVVPGAR